MPTRLDKIRAAAIPPCKKFNVKRLDLFGSTATGKETSKSDIDFLVEFQHPDEELSHRYFGLLHQLEDTLGCEIDLLTADTLTNPYFRRRVLKEKVNIYGG